MGALAKQLGYENRTDTNISRDEIHELTDAQLSHRLIPLGIKLAENCTTEEVAVEGMLLAEAGMRLAGPTAYTKGSTGELVEPEFLPLNEKAKATILHALDRFVSEGCEVPEGCTHFDGLGDIPDESQILDLIEYIERSEGVALYVDPGAPVLAPEAEEETFEYNVANILSGLSNPNAATAADAVQEAYNDPTTVGALVNATTGEVTPLRLGPETSLLLMELANGGPITKEYLDQTTEQFRQSLVDAGFPAQQAARDAALVNREISELL